MSIPFIHIADVHLGRLQGRTLSEAQLAQRRTDAMLALLATLDMARAEQTPLFFIAGDLFDNEMVNRSIIKELCDRMSALSATRFFIAAGNHDYAGSQSYYRTASWPDNVHLFLAGWSSVQMESLGVTVHGCGFSAAECEDSGLRDYQIIGNDSLNAIVMHADVTAGRSRYRPISRAELASCGADYVALGHVHAPQAFTTKGEALPLGTEHSGAAILDAPLYRAAYSGALEPLDFGEEGPHGYVRGTLEKGGARLEFVPCAIRQYHRKYIDVSDIDTTEAVLELARQVLADTPDRDLVRLILQGCIHPDLTFDQLRLAEVGSRFFVFDIEDQTTPGEDIAALAEGFTVRAYFVRRMLALMDSGTEEERQRAARALRVGLAALAGREVRLI